MYWYNGFCKSIVSSVNPFELFPFISSKDSILFSSITIDYSSFTLSSPPVRRQWGRRDRPQQSIVGQDDSSLWAAFFPVDEHRVYALTSTPPRMLHPTSHSTQQTPFMVDLHEQVTVHKIIILLSVVCSGFIIFFFLVTVQKRGICLFAPLQVLLKSKAASA